MTDDQPTFNEILREETEARRRSARELEEQLAQSAPEPNQEEDDDDTTA